MYTGNQKIKVASPAIITIKADAGFTAYGCVSGKPVYVLGPFNNSQMIRVTTDPEITELEVKTSKSTNYNVVIQEIKRHDPVDPTPIDMALDKHRPPSLKDEMKRYIRETLSTYMHDKYEAETFEEANDFDVDTSDDWTSPYELQDMYEDSPYIEQEAEGEANAVTPIPTQPPEEKTSLEAAQEPTRENPPSHVDPDSPQKNDSIS